MEEEQESSVAVRYICQELDDLKAENRQLNSVIEEHKTNEKFLQGDVKLFDDFGNRLLYGDSVIYPYNTTKEETKKETLVVKGLGTYKVYFNNHCFTLNLVTKGENSFYIPNCKKRGVAMKGKKRFIKTIKKAK